MRSDRAAGFTLIETVVALLVVALGMTAVYMQLNYFAANAISMQDRTLASWIASNVVTEFSLQTEWPELAEDEYDIEYAGREWRVFVEIAETEVESLRRCDVSVALVDRPERIIHTVSGLLEPPTPGGLPPVSWILVGGGPRG